MSIKWDALFQNEKKQFDRMTEQEKFIYFLLLQYGSPYGWGHENPETSDCSGAVCMALYAATGHLIRTTADDLYKRVFTIQKPKAGTIRAAFFIKNGIATHVAGLVDDEAILNSQDDGGRVRSLDRISAWFWNKGHSTAVRGLDREALVKLSREKARYGLDPEMSKYFDMSEA
jgi:murein DD-endopeptidase